MPAQRPRPTRAKPPRPPLQERSQRTLDALLGATEHLLRDRSFEAIGIKEICERAGCTTGAFYARFDSKDDLLPWLYQRYDRELQGRTSRAITPEALAGLTLQQACTLVAERVVTSYRKDRWLLRAVGLFARIHPEAIDPEMLERRRLMHEGIVQLFAPFHREIRHQDWECAARTGIYFAMAIGRDRILFAEAPHATLTPLTDTELAADIAHMLFAYLTT